MPSGKNGISLPSLKMGMSEEPLGEASRKRSLPSYTLPSSFFLLPVPQSWDVMVGFLTAILCHEVSRLAEQKDQRWLSV